MQNNIQEPKKIDYFRHKEDVLPVCIILMLSFFDFVLYFSISNPSVLFAYYLLMIIPKILICAWNHHHQHSLTFHNPALNRWLELFYALHTGVTTHLWRLHHVLGHHLNFLDQKKDESRWQRKDGSQMGVIEYTLIIALTAYPRGYSVGKRHPKKLKTFLRYLVVTFFVVAMLVWHNPVAAIFLFVLPMITSFLFTTYVTYDHHTGLDTKNQFEASYNNINPIYNLLTGNLGYHTAHHFKHGVHWSKLPALHASIAEKIPKHLYQSSIFTRRITTE